MKDFFSVELISRIICELKLNKAAGYDNITTEHLLHCHPIVHVFITYLCNLMLLSGLVPTEFGVGVTFPIPKSNIGKKIMTVEDFRGITVSPIVSKILEKGILSNFGSYLNSSDNQFGFKRRVGCSHAIYTLHSVINHFVNNGSTVNVCSLDVSKAFDRVNHYSLFCKLIDRHVPVNVLMILMNWYDKCVGVVKWKGAHSSTFKLMAGVRQGGSLSPDLFAILVDALIVSILKSGLGCHIDNMNFGIIMYADDLVLVSASVYHLQLMIDICLGELDDLDLSVNLNKSVCIRFGKRSKVFCSTVSIDGISIPWSNSMKYLGIVFISGKSLSFDFKTSRSNFFRCFNSIFSKISRASETVIVSLLKSNCIPILMYGVEALDLKSSTLYSLDNPLRLAFGKIFKSYDKNILNSCLFYMNTLPLSLEYLIRRIRFLYKSRRVENTLLSKIHDVLGKNELLQIFRNSQLDPKSNSSVVKSTVWMKFQLSLM